MKKFGLAFLVFALVVLSAGGAFAQSRTNKYAALVVNADNGTILHQRNANAIRYPASLTKMMTLYLAFDAIERGELRMNQRLRVSEYAASQRPLKLGLREGQQITVRDAILGLIIKSANDASVVLAEELAGTEWQFARQMTAKARELGMNNTTYRNASGWPDDEQVTTAVDQAKLAIALKRDHPDYFPLFAQNSFNFRGSRIETHNRVTKNYRGATGLKTGYINASGFNLVTTATRGNTNLVGVVLGGVTSKKRDAQMISLLDNAFARLGGSGAQQQMASASKNKPNAPTPESKPRAELASFEREESPVPVSRPQRREMEVRQQRTSARTTVNTTRRERGWAIQVGKFKREKDAINAVAHAMDLAGDHLEATRVTFTKTGPRKAHSAKLANLTEYQAKSACSALRSARESCQVVRLYN